MGTRASITVKDGSVFKTIYCHWDGYPEGVGKTLHTYYHSTKKALALIALGSISSLHPSIECPEGHTFDSRIDGYTVAYKRDRGETDVDYITYTNYLSALRRYGDGYNYLWDGKKWLVNGVQLSHVLKHRKKCPHGQWKDENIDWSY